MGIGLGFDSLGIQHEMDGEDWPGVDLRGNVGYNYTCECSISIQIEWLATAMASQIPP